MNKIQELLKNKFNIKEIKKVKLKDVADFSNGKGHEKVVEKDGKYILITSKAISTDMEQIRRTNLMLSPLFKDDITMVMSDLPNGKALAKCFIVDEDNKYTLNQRICSIKVKNKEIILPKFLYYYLNRNSQLLKYDDGTNQTNLKKDDIINIKIAVPPMEVQREIVRILDKFTLYSVVLSAELILRKKQYEYYMDYLTCFYNIINKVKFEDIATIQRGASPRPINKFLTDDLIGINWIKIGDVEKGRKYITKTKEKITKEGAEKARKVKKGDFVLSNSMSFGRPYILAIDGCIHDGWLCISNFEDKCIPDFLYHLLNSSNVQKQFEEKASYGGAVHNLNSDIVKNIELTIPSLEEQKRIVDILDRFYMLTYDLTFGLPAEIEARQKQYEYYRDKLLSFD